MASSKRRRFPSPQTRSSGESRSGTTTAKHTPKPEVFEPRTPEVPATPARVIGQNTAFELDRVGTLLRQTREHRGEDLYTIADFLRIRPDFLAALENSRYEELPADAYVTGFLRSYASYLGLDSRAVIDQYRREMAGRRRRPQLNMPKPLSEGRAPTAVILIGAAIASLLIYVLWYGLSTSSRTVADTPPPIPQTAADVIIPAPAANGESASTPVTEPSPGIFLSQAAMPATTLSSIPEPSMVSAPDATAESAPAQTPAVAAKEQPPAPIAVRNNDKPEPAPKAQTPEAPKVKAPKGEIYGSPASPAHIAIKADKESWILVTDSRGNTVFDKILKPGDVYNVPDIKDLTLTVGNGNGLILSLDGVDLPRLAPDSRLVRNVPLDPAHLKSR